MGDPEYVLEMNHISKSFPGVKALDDVTLKVRPGTVHALMGENGAGKSTLMKCLFGIYVPDEGEVRLAGKPIHFDTTRQALDAGISMIPQELMPVPCRPVMENLWLGRFPVKKYGPFSFVDSKKMLTDTKSIFKSLNMEDIDPKIWVRNLSVSKRQLLEIAKAVSYTLASSLWTSLHRPLPRTKSNICSPSFGICDRKACPLFISLIKLKKFSPFQTM